jgi:hypothetical protein
MAKVLGPENAQHELRKAYNCVIETGTTHFWDRKQVPGVNPDEVVTLYKQAFDANRRGNRLVAERWARTAKHLSRAFWHEAKIAYLEPRVGDIPYLEGAETDEYFMKDHSDTAEDLLESVAIDLPPGTDEMPEPMKRYLARARKHLEVIKEPQYKNELLIAERVNAAHEYGRVIECMALAYEADSGKAA